MKSRNRTCLQSVILLLGGMFLQSGAFAQNARDKARGIWQDEKEADVLIARKMPASKRTLVPQVYRTVSVDRAALGAVLAAAPQESARGVKPSVELALPMPDGSSARFKVQESPIMDPKLAAEFPEIKTYIAQGIDDPTLSARLDHTPQGFHAIIFTGSGSVYIDPYWRDDATTYISYRRSDYSDPEKGHKCLVEGADHDHARDTQRPATALRPTGASLRTYRMAVACTGEYAAAAGGGTVPGALAAITTTVNRVTAVYERDFAIRLVLVGGNSSIIFTNAATDGFTDNDAGLLINESQTKIDAIIGNANYDIGHTFSTGGGGLAGLGVVGITGQKARGITGSANPVGDAYDIDYVAHEVGHQFGANHTFNGTTAGGNRNGPTAYEPGSGSTIMAYAGIMAPEDLQNNSDDCFHTASYDEIDAYTTGASPGNCGVATATGNTPPTIGALTSFTIPNQTPFALTASATDPNGGDVLTYCWEEFDKGAAQNPAAAPRDNGASPIFRSFDPTTSPVRTFPSLTYILNNSNVPPATIAGGLVSGEFLPTTNRTMNFRVTIRDNRAGGGGSNYASTTVTSTTSSGPFALTSFNTASTIAGGSAQTINWAVANSNLAPVNCANVKISLSTDGGLTYPFVLAASTPNDGSESVTIANTATSQGRFKVEAVGNIFFDLSDANTTITNTGGGPGFVEQFETGLSTLAANVNFAPPGATISLATGDWYGLNMSSPIGTTGIAAAETSVFPPDASGQASYAVMNFNSGSGTSQISTFLMSPTKTFNNGDTISFLTRSADNGFPDRLRLLFSASGASTDAAAFTTTLLSVNEGLTTTDYPKTWTLFTATISGLSGPTSGRFAFNYNVPNGGSGGSNSDYIGIDVVTYTPVSLPEIAVEQPLLTDIPDTGTKDFGSVAVGSSTDLTFTLKNTGNSNLTGLTITKDGTNASDFTVTANPTAPVIGGTNTTFTVRFAPSSAGSRTAAIHIANNDSDENPFDITLTGTGTSGGSGFVEQFETGLSADGANTASPGAVLTLATGDWYGLNSSSPIGITGVFGSDGTGLFPPDASGLATYAAMNYNNGSNVSQISTFLMSPTKTFNNGDTISFLTRTVDTVEFPDRLRLLFSASGASTDPAAFTTTLLSVNETLTTTGYPSTWTLFTATISGLSGPTSGRFAFNYNVPNGGTAGSNSDTIGIDVVTYTPAPPALLPEIAVEQPLLTNIADSGTKAFGSVLVGTSTDLTFTIKNTGSGNLTGLTITKDGAGASSFTVITPPVAPVLPGSTTNFTVRFTPAAAGFRTAAIHIANNDTNENPFDITLTGTGTVAPEIAVEQPLLTNVADGSTKAFGSVAVGTSTDLTFTIKNTGNGNLTGLTITKDGAGASSFTVITPPVAPVIPGSTTNFTVRFTPTAAGFRTAAIHIANNDSNENPFDITLSGTGTVAPEIAVEQPLLTNIADGGTKAFGSVAIGSSTNLTFTIKNTGTANLTGLTITKDGAGAASFTVITPPVAPVLPGSTTNFTVRFSPAAAGYRTAAIHIANNDSNENPFDITLSGTGTPAPEIAVEQPLLTNIADNSPKAFGSVVVGSSKNLTFIIKNTGTANLTGLTITKDGAGASSFTVITPPVSPVLPGSTTNFTVRFLPTAAGFKTAAIHIANNDSNENPFDITLNGTGAAARLAGPSEQLPSWEEFLTTGPSVDLAEEAVSGQNRPKSVVTVEQIGGRKYLAIAVAKSPGENHIKRIVEVSPNLLDWYSGRNHTTVLQNDAKVLKVRDNTPVTPEAKRYIRLK